MAELAHGLVVCRSTELSDVVARLIGAMLGAASTSSVLLLSASRKSVGLIVAMLGAMFALLFLLADVVGVGDMHSFGLFQLGCTVLGTMITLGGVFTCPKSMISNG